HLGGALSAAGRQAEAEASLRRAIELNPNDPQAHYNLGVLLRQGNQLEAAIDAHQRAIGLNANMAESHFNLSRIYRDQERWAEAEASYARSAAVAPKGSTKALNCQAAMAIQQGKEQEALTLWRRLLELDREHAEANFRVGSQHQAEGNLQAAVEHLE